jgi:hypothetical protein
MSKTSYSYEAVTFYNSKNTNDLSIFTDDELYGLYQLLENRRNISEYDVHCKLYEVEIAYVQREQQIRFNRITANQSYLETYWNTSSYDEDQYQEFDQNSNNEFIWLDSLRNDIRLNNKSSQRVIN